MPYYSGQVSNFNNLHAAVVAAAQTEGWTWSAANNTLEKNGVAFEMIANGTTTNLRFRAGESVNGSGVLQNPQPQFYGIYNGTGDYLISWPLDYKLFFKDDSVVISVNYNVFFWQHVCIGRAINLGVAGNCNYIFGSSGTGLVAASYNYPPFAHNSSYPDCGLVFTDEAPAFFGLTTGQTQWTGGRGSSANTQSYKAQNFTRQDIQPNRYNNQVVLAPIQISAQRPSATYSYIAEIPNVRCTRNTYFNDGDIFTLGPDRWMILPWFRRNIQTPAGGAGHSGTYALAIPYDGP